MTKGLTERELIAVLRARCAGNPTRWARRNRVNRVYVHNVLSGRDRPGPQIQRALGVKRQGLYVEAT